jgi:hypothetical protein
MEESFIQSINQKCTYDRKSKGWKTHNYGRVIKMLSKLGTHVANEFRDENNVRRRTRFEFFPQNYTVWSKTELTICTDLISKI